ncbi:MAG: hypothetical protein HY827_09315 [Actinobacteria bacterium]|nr:hypothetical protein [Actinomycetota bacterium]
MKRFSRLGRVARGVLTLAIVAVCAVTVVAGAAVTRGIRVADTANLPPLDPPTISPSGPLVNMSNLEPGDQKSASFVIGNPNKVAAVARIFGELTGGDQQLYDVLGVELASSDGAFWSGPLSALMQSSSASTVLAAHSDRPITLTIAVPSELGNDFQSRLSQFNLKFALDYIIKPSEDHIAPVARLRSVRPGRGILKRSNAYQRLRRKKVIIFYGRASDEPSGVDRVEVSLMRIMSRRGKAMECRSWSPVARKYIRNASKGRSCTPRLWFSASGTDRFRFLMYGRKMILRGRYVARVRAVDKAGNVETKLSPRRLNVLRFSIR